MIEYVQEEIKTLLENSMASRITTFYTDEVALTPQSYLPALMVIGNSEEIIAKSTACDQYIYNITVRVVLDLKKFLDEAGTGDTIKSQQQLKKIMGERDSSTGAPKSDTVLGTLRKPDNIRGIGYLFNNNIATSYTLVPQEGWFYVKAEATFTIITDLILRQ